MAGQVNRHCERNEAIQRRPARIAGLLRRFAPRNDAMEKFVMNHDAYADSYIREILNGVKSIAMVGASPVNVRPSYFAFKYLAQRGYDMIPVNPGHVGKSLLGKPFVASLLDIGRPIDMVEIFRNSSHIMLVVDEALKFTPLPKVNWMSVSGGETNASDRAAKNKSDLS